MDIVQDFRLNLNKRNDVNEGQEDFLITKPNIIYGYLRICQ